ncbi:MAG: DUF1508 domain-containing protein [Planctomycetota bacterium]
MEACYALLTGFELDCHFVLVGEDGEALVTSRPYDSAEEATRGVAEARRLGPDIEAYERWHVDAGWGFTLRGPGGELAHSAPFPSDAARDAAVEATRRLAGAEALVDLQVASTDWR